MTFLYTNTSRYVGLLILSGVSSLAFANPFAPAELHVSQTDFGGVGLMQMPSGRMAPNGELSLNGSFNNEYNHGAVSLQVMPWFETTIRYTMVQDLLYSNNANFSGDTEYTDKGIDLKIRLLKESNWLPETSFGMRDIGGTGLFDGEFIAASKRFNGLDFTLGMGWGYLGTSGNISNPFCKVSDSYCDRIDDYNENGGTIEYNKWFEGPSSIFAGIEYQTPHQPLRFKVEYDSNDYSSDKPVVNGAVDMTQHTPWNVGFLYRLQNWGDLKVSYERGDTLTLGFTLRTNFNSMRSVWRDAPEPTFKPSSAVNDPQWDELADQLSSNAGYNAPEILLSENNITVTGEQKKYRDLDIAHKRAALLLSQIRAPEIGTFTFIETSKGMKMKETHYDADQFAQVANYEYIGATLDDAKMHNIQPSAVDQIPVSSAQHNAFSFGISPTLTQTLGSAETFYFYALGLTAATSYQLTPSLELSGSVYVNLFDNYDKFNYLEDATGVDNFSTPRVRTLFRSYVNDSAVRMNNLQLTWFDQFDKDIYFQAYAGYLEMMFAGIGGEVLYRPENTNWAIGVDLNYVSQRKPNSWLSTYSDDYFEYSNGSCPDGEYTVDCASYVLSQGETGFLNVYYTPKTSLLKNTLLQANIGQFLGQDKGVRFDFSKQFDSGVITGVYASFSDLSADEFGEGSFTKGFYVSIPFDIMTVKPSRSRAVIGWQPLTRDGGQTLSRKYQLYNITDSRSPWFTKPSSQ